MFSKILIANRGEIAIRIIRACKEMGISTVAVYSEADKDALHVSLADESVCIGPAKPADSYLNISAILSAATATKAQAIHPGYGFLSENARFANLCAQCKIAFIGPASEVITSMGDKDNARKTMIKAGVPVIPGTDIIKNAKEGIKEAEKIGYPILIKARAGGGGKGIRLVEKKEDFEAAFLAASTEAKNAFGDGKVYIEKYLSPVKHIEMQILADSFGNVRCLGERDCSMQRKKQKMIEESPSPVISDDIRNKMMEASIKAVKATNYTNAGTIEFLLDKDNNFYFMEMNTRLQVEHPVTEIVTGIDIVKWQIRIAAGVPINFPQDEITFRGSAIECRINAENPDKGFIPNAGKVTLLHIPGGPRVRFDTALYQDYDIPPYYDSMIGKLIVYAKTREEAIRKMKAALCELIIGGIDTNIDFQMRLLDEEKFKDGTYGTDFLN